MLECLLLGPAVVAAVGPGGPVGLPRGRVVDRLAGVAVGPPGSDVVPILYLLGVLPLLLLLHLCLLQINYLPLFPSPSFLLFKLLLLLLRLILADEFGGMLLLKREVPNVGCWHFGC